jgi:putative pyruvate formate lyase activating enzyme
MDDGYGVASICLHKGEEPPIGGERGICNVFFSHCNLQCVYCQNHQISRNDAILKPEPTIDEIIEKIIRGLDGGSGHLGFVSPTHMVSRMVDIINAVRKQDRHPVIVYNSNGYDRIEILRQLESYVDVYLPDFKYADPRLGRELSGAEDYPASAIAAIDEMIRQKGTALESDPVTGRLKGVIIRHLVLPGYVQNSMDVLNLIAGEFSTNIHVSLMAQYSPTGNTAGIPHLNRPVFRREYETVTAELERLGFANGWIQELDSKDHLRPDFDRRDPFGMI